jgi:hypothetical protein
MQSVHIHAAGRHPSVAAAAGCFDAPGRIRELYLGGPAAAMERPGRLSAADQAGPIRQCDFGGPAE